MIVTPESKSLWRGATSDWLPIFAGLLLLYVPTFYDLATSLWREEDYAHGPIILAIIVWLIWDKREFWWLNASSPSPLIGLGLVVTGLLCYVLGRTILIIPALEVGSLVPILAGVILVMRGPAALRALWFPLIFVAYLFPLPGIFVDGITGPLKQHVSTIVEQILYAADYPIARNGVMLTVGNYQLIVGNACSGINSMFSLSAVGLLYLYLMKRRSSIHNGLILSSLLPIAFCANVLRVLFLVLLTYHFGDAVGQGYLHKFSGMVLFVISLVLILALDVILSRLIKNADERVA